MKQFLRLIHCCSLLLFFSCANLASEKPVEHTAAQPSIQNPSVVLPDQQFQVDLKALVQDFGTWYNYTYNNIRLSQDFIARDSDSMIIEKARFISQLESGQFIPVKTGVQASKAVYQLCPVTHLDKDILLTVKQLAATEKEHMHMEGKQLPPFDFTDLNGKRYNKAATAGKTWLIKCWFINCFACVQEFPQLNQLVGEYAGTTDLLFVSLATDAPEALTSFLAKKPFRYAVVPNAGAYMSVQLHITAYPTHLLIDKSGTIIKVTNSIEDMLPFLPKH